MNKVSNYEKLLEAFGEKKVKTKHLKQKADKKKAAKKAPAKKAAAKAAASRLNVTHEKPASFCRELKHGGRAILIAGL